MRALDCAATAERNLSNVIKIDEGQIQQHTGEMVRSTVHKILTEILDAEADQLCHTGWYEHTEALQACGVILTPFVTRPH